MYKAYKITSNDLQEALQKDMRLKNPPSRASNILNKQPRPSLKPKLLAMVNAASLQDECINADSIWDDWFPEVKSDVFISHSSKDSELAEKLSKWLRSHFGLTAFIDSDIWGHSDDLLKEIDDKYCLHSKGSSYSYKLRNASTAHVHMMLSYALTRMIYKTECCIFLESKNSVTVNDAIQGTYSPWIFHELAMIDSIELKAPERLKKKTEGRKAINLVESHNLKIKYPITGKRLIEIESNDLNSWNSTFINSEGHSLDTLYQLTHED